MLRLTLRTLLAYLDDTLEPTEARLIGQKVAESDQARDLMERIKQVTRRRRITTPPPSSAIDANTMAEYLDNEVSPEQAAEVEQVCLSSDAHLAEAAACHQVLTVILGEPASVPAAATQRMYDLVKGTPAPAGGKRPRAGAKPNTELYGESRELDETLRMGLPALRRKDGWRNPLLMFGGGAVAAALLILALWQVLSVPGTEDNPNPALVQGGAGDGGGAKNNQDKAGAKKVDGLVEGPNKNGAGGKTEPDNKDKDKGKDAPPKKDKDGPDAKEPDVPNPKPAVKDLAIPEVPAGPPSDKQAPIGRLLPADDKESVLLLQAGPEKSGWKRLGGKPKGPDTVYSARPLVSLPGSKSTIQTMRGLKVTLWANASVNWPPATLPFRYESAAELHVHDALDLEITVRRGRLVLENTEERPVVVRLRVENPMFAGQLEFFDLALEGKGTEVVVDHWSYFSVTEPFYKDPKVSKRVGPTAEFGILVMAGNMLIKHGDVTFAMGAAPGRAVVAWKSSEGLRGPFDLKGPPDIAPRPQPAMVKARDEMAAKLAHQEIDVVLAEALASPTPTVRRQAVLCLAALDNLPALIEALDQEQQGDVRATAHEALRNWISLSRPNDYALYDLLKVRYKGKEADIIMEMLHYFAPDELKRPERFEILIDNLTNSNLVIRELAHWHLVLLVPQGRNIPYSASMDRAQREQAQMRWYAIVPPGQLPPAPPMKK